MAQVTYLELSEGQEHKFYEVTLAGAELTLRYGRIGTDGQTQRKTFADAHKAQAEADKKLAEKRKKGYADAVKGETAKKAVEKPRIKLHKAFEPYRDRIEASLKPVMHLTLSEGELTPLDSKVGGIPYRPHDQPWPVDTDGNPLVFLAQLNFAQLPALPGFPTVGLLQFFIGTSDLYGCDFMRSDPNDPPSYEVRWFPDVVSDRSTLDESTPTFDPETDYAPIDLQKSWKIEGKVAEQPISSADRLFEAAIGLDFLDEADSPNPDLVLGEWLQEKYSDIAEYGHQVGGYPYFTQADPRELDDPRILLFQLDTDGDYDVMWGDSGIGNFFIHPDDLAKQDFSRVAYNWDCC